MGTVFIVNATSRLQLVDKFSYLGNMLGRGRCAEQDSRIKSEVCLGLFNDLVPILALRGASHVHAEGASLWEFDVGYEGD